MAAAMRRLFGVLAGIALLGVLSVAAAPMAFAHPLGNFTSNTFTRLRIQADRVAVDYVVDLAEIPALQTVQKIDTDGDGQLDAAQRRAFAENRCAELAAGLRLSVDEAPTPLRVQTAAMSLSPGQAGLRTLRLECGLRSDAVGLVDGAVVAFADTNLADRVGWREVIAVGDGRSITTSDVADESISDELRTYPQNRLASPLDVTSATLTLGGPGTGGGAESAAPVPGAGPIGVLERLTASFTGAVASRELTLAFGLLAGLIAIALGSVHALAPGHGKTVMAAYLIGRQGTGREALALGATVAVTHTTGVLLLGLVVSATEALAPERLYPILGAASGVLFTIVGVTLLRQAVRNRRRSSAGDNHGHDHGHDHGHGHGHGHDHPPPRPGVGWRALVLPGLAGGLVPTPSALVVLLGGIALGRTWFGVVLVLGYGVGMAAALVGAGYLLVRARAGLARRASDRPHRLTTVTAALPVVTACLITVSGVAITARALLVA